MAETLRLHSPVSPLVQDLASLCSQMRRPAVSHFPMTKPTATAPARPRGQLKACSLAPSGGQGRLRSRLRARVARVSPFPRASHLLGSSEVCNLWRLPLPYSHGPPFERQQLAVAVGTEGDLMAAQAAPPPRWEVAFLGTFREPATPGFHAAQKSDFILLQK